MGRVLGLDVGERRIGVAVSDPERRVAVPLRVLERQTRSADLQALAEIVQAEDIDTLVVGHPLSMDGTAGPQAKKVESYARRLARDISLPIDLWDERLTSVQAEKPVPEKRRSAKARAPKTRKNTPPADDVAAALMLQSYLDRKRVGEARAVPP